jgi:transposase
MDHAPLPDLDALDRDALVALIRANQEELTAPQDELRSLQIELESQRQTVSQQADELRTRRERIEHMKLMIEKLRHTIFGTRSEKFVFTLEQLEFELGEEETTQAEMEAVCDRVSPAREAKTRPQRKPLQEHLQREVVTHVPGRDCCPDCGSQLRHSR